MLCDLPDLSLACGNDQTSEVALPARQSFKISGIGQLWNEHSANRTSKASSRPNAKAPLSKLSIRIDVGDRENAAGSYVPNSAGGPSERGRKATENLERPEAVGWFNDDEAEKRKQKKSAESLGQQSTMSDGHMDPGPAVNELNARKQPVRLDTVESAAPVIVLRDVMDSNFEEWMKMATDDVSIRFSALRLNRSICVLLVTNQAIFLSSFVDRKSTRTTCALVYYSHDMSPLRNDTDNLIDFQRASCKLDGCVET